MLSFKAEYGCMNMGIWFPESQSKSKRLFLQKKETFSMLSHYSPHSKTFLGKGDINFKKIDMVLIFTNI